MREEVELGGRILGWEGEQSSSCREKRLLGGKTMGGLKVGESEENKNGGEAKEGV